MEKEVSSSLIDLPPEIITKIYIYLCAGDIANASQTCRVLRSAGLVKTVWQSKCYQEYKMSSCDSWQTTFQDVYTKVLYKYGGVLGLWQLNIKPYGGVVHVKLDWGKIMARQYCAPVNPHVAKHLRVDDLFSISLEDQGTVKCSCHRGFRGSHSCEIIIKDGGFALKCCDIECHRHPEGKQKEFELWIAEEMGLGSPDFMLLNHGQDLLISKFNTTVFHNGDILMFEPLKMPSTKPRCPIGPGLFKGHYGGHGIELILLTYTDEGIAQGIKVTGDPNVPAGAVSLYGDTNRPMILTNQQQSIELLEAIDIPDSPPDVKLDDLPQQPFIVPTDCFVRDIVSPNICKYRFHAKGRIAGHGYTNPSLTPCHWVVFNEHLFGIVWLELQTFSVFSRIEEDFT